MSSDPFRTINTITNKARSSPASGQRLRLNLMINNMILRSDAIIAPINMLYPS